MASRAKNKFFQSNNHTTNKIVSQPITENKNLVVNTDIDISPINHNNTTNETVEQKISLSEEFEVVVADIPDAPTRDQLTKIFADNSMPDNSVEFISTLNEFKITGIQTNNGDVELTINGKSYKSDAKTLLALAKHITDTIIPIHVLNKK